MKKSYQNFKSLFLMLSLSLTASLNAQFTQGRIVAYQVGDGSAPLTNASTPTFLKEYTTTGAAGISVVMPVAGGARITASGSATSEGLITLSAGGQYIIVPGYDAAAGVASISTSTGISTARVIDTVSFLAIPGRATSTTFFSANNTRGAASDGNNNYWQTGGSSGMCYTGSAGAVAVSTTVTNERCANVFNNKLYFSTGSATKGIYQVGAGAPPTTGLSTAISIISATITLSPYQFAINKNSDVCYVADDQANATGGIQKWTYSAGTWSLAYILGTGVANIGARGLAVDWSTPNPTLYGTSAEGSLNRIFSIVDAGAGSAATTLVTATPNTLFRGITFAPYCTSASITTISSNGPICLGQSLNLNATVSGSNPVSVNWSGAGTFSNPNIKNPTVTGATSSDYTFTTSNSCGSNSFPISVIVNPLPTVSANTTATLVCAGQPVTLTGGGANTYSWTAGVTNGVAFNPLTTKTYTVTGTDVNNCVNTATVNVATNPLPVVSYTANPTSVCMGGNLTLTAGGTATSYTWAAGVNDGVAFTPTVTTTYTVSGTDANSCVNTTTVSVPVNALPNVTAAATPTVICAGSNLVLSGGGATTYTWTSSAANGVAFTPTVTADYTVTGTDANSCTGTQTINVVVNNLPVVAANTTATVVCSGQPVTLTGGGATSYTWSNSVTDGVVFNPTSTNTYTVTGTDANNCVNTATVNVAINSLPAITYTTSTASVCMGGNLTLTSGGSATTYTWSSGVNDGIAFTPTVTTTYTVTGTDANFCVNTATVNVPVYNLPNVLANATPFAVCTGSNLVLSGGGAVTYTWTSSVSNGIAFTPTATADYTVTGTDVNNCVNTATVNVVVNSLPIVSAGTSSTSICIGNSVSLNGGGALTYSWSSGVTDGAVFTPTATATYTVTGTDINNCSNTQTVTVVVNNLPAIMINVSPNDSICLNDPVTLNGSGGVAYVWTSGVSDGVAFTPSVTATYSVNGTDANGCADTASIQIVINPCTAGINGKSISQNVISVYPNPSNGNMTIKSDKELGSITVYNSLGEVVYSQSVNLTQHQIDLSKQAQGIYFLQAQGTYTRLIKE
jgi:hypothetical protein